MEFLPGNVGVFDRGFWKASTGFDEFFSCLILLPLEPEEADLIFCKHKMIFRI